MQTRLSRAFYVLISLPSTAMGFALSVQIMVLSWLLDTRYHLKLDEIGIVWAAGPIAGIVGQLAIGVVSDRTWQMGGRRRPYIVIGGALTALMLFLLPRIDAVCHLIGVGNILLVATAVALVLDLSINIGFNPTRAIIADVTPHGAARTRGYAWMQTISGFWGVMAYLIGAWLGNDVLIDGGTALVLLFSVVPMLFIAEPPDCRANDDHAAREVQTDWGQLSRIYAAHGFSWLGAQTMFVYVIAFVRQHLVPDTVASADIASKSGQIIGLSFAIMSTVGFLLPLLALAPLAIRFGRARVHATCVAIMAAGCFAIAYAVASPVEMYAWMAILGIGWGAIVSLPFAIMSDKVGGRQMGLFMGIFNLSVVLPQLFSSLVLGKIVLATPNKNVIFLICGSSLMVSAICWCCVKEGSRAKLP